MKELSLNILDVAKNSVKAGATAIHITLDEKDSVLTLVISDDGCGMSAETLANVTDPFFTTRTQAVFHTDHIDFTPLGDIISTVTVLISGSPDTDWFFTHTTPEGAVELNTPELREALGDVPLDNYEVIRWIEEYLREGYDAIRRQ